MKIAIIGTRGIPNFHGGFEQFAEYFSLYLVKMNHEVYVYNSSDHPYQKPTWNGVNIIHKMDPEKQIGTAGQFFYDLHSIIDCRKRGFDVILQLGYTSSSIWGWLLPKKSIVITNMDGLEWKRSKYSRPVRRFLKFAEKLAVKTSDYLISDSIGIKEHLKTSYKADSEYIAYGADLFSTPSEQLLVEYGVGKFKYNLLIARLEPENNIEVILDGVVKSNSDQVFLIIGKHKTKFGNYLKNKFKNYKKIRFLGGIYNLEHLNNLRHWSNLYFHGHSVGGTNPSLLEAMASSCFIIAHDNVFNRSILSDNAFYFNNEDDIVERMGLRKKDHIGLVQKNMDKIQNEFNWQRINQKYENFIIESWQRQK